MSAATTTEPRVWIGSLAAYNAGHLIGAWYPATEAGDVTVADLHADTDVPYSDDDELWCFDIENMPIAREMDPAEAARWGEIYEELDSPEQWPALCAWVRSGAYTAEGDTDFPVLAEAEEAYAGQWPTFRDYAEDLADEVGLLNDVPDDLRGYIDMDRWARDLQYDYSTVDAPTGVYVFRNH